MFQLTGWWGYWQMLALIPSSLFSPCSHCHSFVSLITFFPSTFEPLFQSDMHDSSSSPLLSLYSPSLPNMGPFSFISFSTAILPLSLLLIFLSLCLFVHTELKYPLRRAALLVLSSAADASSQISQLFFSSVMFDLLYSARQLELVKSY